MAQPRPNLEGRPAPVLRLSRSTVGEMAAGEQDRQQQLYDTVRNP
jgi:hypothetical protein